MTAQFGWTDAEVDAEDAGRWDADSYNFALRGDQAVGIQGREYLFSLAISGGSGDSDTNRQSLLPTLGFDLTRDFMAGSVKVAPRFSAAWRHEFADRIGSVQGRLGGETVMLTALPLDDDRDTGLVELGVDVQPAKRLTMNFGYNRELGGAYRSYEWYGGRLSIEF